MIDRFTTAVREGDVAAVRELLGVRADLANARMAWPEPYGALQYAVIARRPELARALMEFGADARRGLYPIDEATSAWMLAVDREYDEMVAIIREEEARRAGVVDGDSAEHLRRAIRRSDENGAIAILQRNEELRQAELDGNGRTATHLASALGLVRLVEWLADNGAELTRKDRDGSTPLDLIGALRHGPEGAHDLQRVVNVLRDGSAGMTARAAVIAGDVEFLRARHADCGLVRPLDDQGWLLKVAVSQDRPDLVKLLLGFGLDPDAKVAVEWDGETATAFSWGMPLYDCARYGKHEMAELLLERGADANGQVYASGTPLSEAYGQRDEAMIALLERFGGKSNASMAGLYRRKDLALRLLAEHGDAVLPDDGFASGTVAEQLVGSAARGGDPEVMKLGLDRVQWPRGDRRWYGAMVSAMGFWNHWSGPWCHLEWDRGGYLACFRMALERCGPPVERQRYGTTVLHAIVTMKQHVRDEERLAFAAAALDAGARLDLRDDILLSTPLGWACRWGRVDLVRLFLDHGADAIEADSERWATPAAWARKKGHAEIVELLRRS